MDYVLVCLSIDAVSNEDRYTRCWTLDVGTNI